MECKSSLNMADVSPWRNVEDDPQTASQPMSKPKSKGPRDTSRKTIVSTTDETREKPRVKKAMVEDISETGEDAESPVS